jgi:hypothetical protein
MTPDYSRIWPWIFAVLIPLMLYRRFRRSFGQQPLSPIRMTLRIVILLIVGATLAPLALRSSAYLSGQIGGLAAGVALALWGAQRTRFIQQNGRLYYIPHTYAGLAVSALVVGRIIYRLVQLYSAGGLSGMGSPVDSGTPGGPASMMRSPLTAAIFFVLIGYYVCYYGWVLWKSKHITAADLEAPQAPSAGAADAITRGDINS